MSKRYSEEFKKEVLEYALQSDKSIRQICQEFGIRSNRFYAWKHKMLDNKNGDGASKNPGKDRQEGMSSVEMADEIRRLRKELSKSHRREEILKKAAIILGDHPQTSMK